MSLTLVRTTEDDGTSKAALEIRTLGNMWEISDGVELARLQKSETQLTKTVATLETEKKQFEEKMTLQTKEFDSVKQQVASLQQEKSKLLVESQEKLKELNILKRENTTAKTAHANLQTEINGLKNKTEELVKNHNAEIAKTKKEAEENKADSDEVNNLKKELEESKTAAQSIATQLEETKKILEKKEAEQATLKSNNAQLKQIGKVMRSKYTAEEKKVKELEEEKQKLEEELKSKQEQLQQDAPSEGGSTATNEGKLEEAHNRLEEVEAQLEQVKKDYSKLESEYHELLSAINIAPPLQPPINHLDSGNFPTELSVSQDLVLPTEMGDLINNNEYLGEGAGENSRDNIVDGDVDTLDNQGNGERYEDEQVEMDDYAQPEDCNEDEEEYNSEVYDEDSRDQQRDYEEDHYRSQYQPPPEKKARMTSDDEVTLDSDDEKEVATVSNKKTAEVEQNSETLDDEVSICELEDDCRKVFVTRRSLIQHQKEDHGYDRRVVFSKTVFYNDNSVGHLCGGPVHGLEHGVQLQHDAHGAESDGDTNAEGSARGDAASGGQLAEQPRDCGGHPGPALGAEGGDCQDRGQEVRQHQEGRQLPRPRALV